MFFEDAKEASALLHVAPDQAQRRANVWCAVSCPPGYIRRLINAERRVAVCDQMSEPNVAARLSIAKYAIISAGT